MNKKVKIVVGDLPELTNDAIDFQEWIDENFPFAIHNNSEYQYSDENYKQAIRCFDKKSLERFAKPGELLIKAFACLIQSIDNYKTAIQSAIEINKLNKSTLYSSFNALLNNNVLEIRFNTKKGKDIFLRDKDIEFVKKVFFEQYNNGEIKEPQKKDSPLAKSIENKKSAITGKKQLTIYRKEVAIAIDATLKKLANGNNYRIIHNLLFETELINSPYINKNSSGQIKMLLKRGTK